MATLPVFALDMNELLEEAFERATSGARELRTGYDFNTARRSLNLLFTEWANKGINLWTLESGILPLVTGVSRYALPTDTVDLVEHSIRQNDGVQSNQSDLTISRISISTYANIPNKLSRGRPIQIYIERLGPNPYINVWPVPQDNSFKLYYWRLRRLEDAGTGLATADVPFRFQSAMVAGLSYYLSMKLPEGVLNIDRLKLQYDEAWMTAADEDREKAPVRWVPRMS